MALRRIRPYSDASIRLPWGQAVAMAAVEAAGIAIAFAFFIAAGLDERHVHTLLVPPLLTFVLVFVTADAPASRPLRVFASYAIVGAISLAAAPLSIPEWAKAVIAVGLSMIAMHRLGLFHPPAIAVALLASLGDYTPAEALITYPSLLLLAVLALGLAWLAHRVFGDRTYPARWY